MLDIQSLEDAIGGGAVRHVATTAAGALITHGYLASNESQQFVGAVLLLVGFAWSAYQKTQVHAKVLAYIQAALPK